ncbi:hypothetical protein [Burkholderia dolosa]|uniref:hypothetical protein n=1 Tax=Burkholderia dolosa TaxID=152500 RepID=UPI0015901592|nr:hypothetical protein [Burkholderia dolosa]
MDKINDGGPAFPIADPFRMDPVTVDEMKRIASGMALRDWFAVKALEGLIAEPLTGGCVSMVIHCTPNFDSEGSKPGDRMATAAYALADAMLRARGEA